MCLSSPSAPTVTNPPTVTDVSNGDAEIRNSRNNMRRRQMYALGKQDTTSGGQLQGNLIDGVRKQQLGA